VVSFPRAPTVLVQTWLEKKGYDGGAADFRLQNGKHATVQASSSSASSGQVRTWVLLEEIDGGFFETTVTVSREGIDMAALVTIAAGHGSNRIAPLFVDAHCPGIVGSIVEDGGWSLGPTAIARAPLSVSGPVGGDDLIAALLRSDRTLPIVAISSQQGLLLHPDLPARLAKELTGLALVTVADDDACWRLTTRLGKALSCYGGAVRLYWPGFRASDNAFQHPLWTSDRMLSRAQTIDAAVVGVCNALRRRLMAVSIAALTPPPMIGRIRVAETTERTELAGKELADQADYRGLADLYAATNTKLQEQVQTLEEQAQTLRQQLYRLQTEAAWADADDDLQPDSGAPPSTVSEAVERARRLFAGLVAFGDDVETGIAGLAAHAGPPEKVFAYLDHLAELARVRRVGPLGRGMVQWLSARNVEASTESETVTNNRSQMDRRTWSDGRGRRQFELHLKPNDSTHPDQCVRIYFDWDETSEQVVVGWVGRHP
jgi:hypothetical protein